MLSPIHETPQETLHLNFPLDSHMKNPSIFSGTPRVENQKNTSPNQDSGFGSGISASESTDSETLSNASLGNIIHYQISNQSLHASIFNQKEAALANLGKIDHQQIENQKLLDSIFNQKEAVLTLLPTAEEPAMTEAEVTMEDKAPKLDFSPEEISWLKQYHRPF